MLIACLGWGSLVWDPRELPLRRAWFDDGPVLQLEFARQSKDGRVTLVLTDQGSLVRSLWALMDCADIEDARVALCAREGTPKTKPQLIGSLERGQANPASIPHGAEWLERLQLDAVVWTALPPKFDNAERYPSEQEVLEYLGDLRGTARDNAEEYVRRAPTQIDTSYRRAIEARFGWTAPV